MKKQQLFALQLEQYKNISVPQNSGHVVHDTVK